MLLKKSKKTFIHVDCDSFFASCEVLRHPELKGKYVLVGGEIVTACSYEAKRMGIGVGMHFEEAKRILKGKGHFFFPDIDFYSKISHLFFSYLEYHTLKIEPFSIDEAFCEITGLPEMYGMSTESFAYKLQHDIRTYIGIPVSIGVSNTHIKSKIFSKVNKPYGICCPDGAEEEYLFETLLLKDIPFIGKSYQKRLKYRCKTVADFMHLGYRQLKTDIGKSATDLWFELMGVNAFIVKKSKKEKFMSRSRSFNKQMTTNKDFLKTQLLKNFNLLFEKMIKKEFEARKIALLLRDKSFVTHIYEMTLPGHTSLRGELYSKLLDLFNTHFSSDLIYRSTGVIFSDLRSLYPRQISLFNTVQRKIDTNLELSKAMNKINSKYGKEKVSYGFNLLDRKLGADYVIRK